ncbi:substrate-binding domain-containing protein [Kribbella sp. GL6]|uniref:substrate-binding domain-containing protein n=1 Tax=Kribbella sp. GL6 TaxID=3419765 RepID=UPI003D047021
MRFIRTARATAIATAALAVVATTALSAAAEPNFTPDNDDVVVVGSDTTEFVLADLANLYNSSNPTRRIASFDATGSAQIQIRPGVTIDRPNGSGAGVNALCGRTDIDAARASRGKGSSDCADSRFLKFAQDHLRWMANSGVTGVTSLTDAQLTSIYNCQTTNWSQLGGPNLPIVPLIPQINSGTRATWAGLVGIPNSPLPNCVKDNVGGTDVQEHDPALVKTTAGSIAPVSDGRYSLLSADQKAGTVEGGISDASTTGYDRNLYQVVKAPGDVVPGYLADLFGDGFGFSSTGGTPFICQPSDNDPATTTAGDVIKANGFFEVSDCGTF